MKSVYRGLFFGVVGSAAYGMNPLFTLPMYREGMQAGSVLLYRYLLAVLILGALLRFRGIGFRLGRGELAWAAACGLLFSLSSLTLFQSYSLMDAGIASTILFVYPLMVAVIMTVFFRERLTPVTAAGIALALCGIALLYRTGDGVSLDPRGTVLILLSALFYAVYIVAVNKSPVRNLPSLKLTFYVILFGMGVLLVDLRGGRDLQAIPSAFSCLMALMIALLPTIVSLLCTNLSILHLGSTPTAILGALEPVTAVFFGVVLFGEAFTLRIACGILLIVLAVSLVIGGGQAALYLRTWLRFRR